MDASSVNPLVYIGPLFIANSLNWFGLGFLLIQIYYYFNNFPSDQKKVRALVWTMLLLELFQTAALTEHTWFYTISSWNNNAALLTFPWSAPAVPMMDGIIGWVVQAFYAWRIWVLASGKILKLFACFIFFLSSAQGITSVVTSIIYWTDLTAAQLAKVSIGFTLWVSVSFAVDVFVAVGMLIVLWNSRSQGIWNKTDSVITKLIVITVGTGSLLAFFGMATLVLFATARGRATGSYQYMPGAYVLGKLYSNSAMVTLNARKHHRALLDPTKPTEDKNSFSMAFHRPNQTNQDSVELNHTQGSTSSSGTRIPVHFDKLEDEEVFAGRKLPATVSGETH